MRNIDADFNLITVAAQRWTHTSFHLCALASGLAGRLDGIELFRYAPDIPAMCQPVMQPVPGQDSRAQIGKTRLIIAQIDLRV